MSAGGSAASRLADPGWSTPGGSTTGWTPVRVGRRDPRSLVAPTGPSVRCTQEVPAASVVELDGDRHLLDFGQNSVGRLRLRADGHPPQPDERGS